MRLQNDKTKKIHISIGMTGIIAIVILALLGIFLFSGNFSKEKKKEIITKSTIEKIINVSELSTFEAVYNGITEVMNETDPEMIDYYVYYESKVKAGIDFEKVKVNIDDNEKKISIIIPEIKINDINVDITSLDYMFENEKANTENVSQQAYKAAIEDATNESSSEDAIYELAEQNAKNIVEALVSPFVKQLDAEYKLEIE